MENFRKAYINENAIKNFREQSRLAAAKERVVHAALTKSASQLVSLYGPNISLDASKDSLTEIRPDVFSGTVEAQLSVETGSGLKRVAFPINVVASEALLDKANTVKAYVDSELNKVSTKEDDAIETKTAEFDNNAMHALDEQAHNDEVNAAMDEHNLTVKEAEMFVFNKKAAADSQAVCGLGQADEPNLGINVMPQSFIKISKAYLPTFNVGDPLDLNGTPYVCVKVAENDYEFQLHVL